MTTTIQNLGPSSAFLEFQIFGVQAPSPGYFGRIAERMAEENNRFNKMIRAKALITMSDVISVLEAA